MISKLAKIIITSDSSKNILRCFCKVWCKSNLCIFLFYWLIALQLFNPLPCNAIFLIVKHSCVREELSDVVFSLQTQLQQITVQEHLVGEFALVHFSFCLCTSPNWHFPLRLPPLQRPGICAVDNFQLFQLQINILDNPRRRRGSHFWFPYTLQSSGDFLCCRETEAHIPLLLVYSLPV